MKTIEELDAHVGEIADTTEFILAEKFECADGQMLGRVLATAGWPSHSTDRMYAKAGDDSNHALRRLQRKYHAALKLLRVFSGQGMTGPEVVAWAKWMAERCQKAADPLPDGEARRVLLLKAGTYRHVAMRASKPRRAKDPLP